MGVIENLVKNPKFDYTILFVIFINCIFLALNDPLKDEEDQALYLRIGDWIFIWIFVLEMILKMIVYSFNGYFADTWNWLDFIVVLEGLISFTFAMAGVSGSGANISAIRTFRVLRPLKTLKYFERLRLLMAAMASSSYEIFTATIFLIIVILFFSVPAHAYFAESLSFKCASDKTGDEDSFVPDSEIRCGGQIQCNHFKWGGTNFPFCIDSGEALNNDVTKFSSVYWSMIATIQVIIMEGWLEMTYALQDSYDKNSWLFSLSIIFICSLGIVHFFPAILSARLQLEEEKVRIAKLEKEGKFSKNISEFERIIQEFNEAESNDIKLIEEWSQNKKKKIVQVEQNLPRFTPKLWFCEDLRTIIKKENGYFSIAIYILIIMNVIVISLEGHNFDKDFLSAMFILNIIFTAIFVIEVIIKLSIFGPILYFQDKYNCIDFILILLSVIEVFIDSFNIFSALRVVRFFRLARILRITTISKMGKEVQEGSIHLSFTRIMGLLSDISVWIGYIFALILLMAFMFAIMGMQIFGGKIEVQDGEEKEYNFDTFSMSYLTVISLITGNKWADVMADAINGYDSSYVMIYFVSWYYISRFILFAFLLATFFNQIERDNLAYLKFSARGTLKAAYSVFNILKRYKKTDGFNRWLKSVELKPNDLMGNDGGNKRKERGKIKLIGEDTIELNTKTDVLLYSPKSLLIFEPDTKIRKYFGIVAKNKFFQILIFVAIITSAVVIALEVEIDAGSREDDKTLKDQLHIVEVFVTSLFCVEAILFSISDGLYFTDNSYLKNNYMNQLDFFVTITSVLALILEGIIDIRGVRLIRLIRMIRPLRLFAHNQSLRRLLDALLYSSKSIKNVLYIMFSVFFIYSVIGMQLFKGRFYSCNIDNYPNGIDLDKIDTWSKDCTTYYPTGCDNVAFINDTSTLILNDDDEYNDIISLDDLTHTDDFFTSSTIYTCPYDNTKIIDINNYQNNYVKVKVNKKNATWHFDNIWNALLSIFILFSFDGWEEILFSAINSTGIEREPSPEASKELGIFFIFLVGTTFLLIYLFVGAIYNTFMYFIHTSDGQQITSLKTAFWSIYETKLKFISPPITPTEPDTFIKKVIYDILTSSYYNIFMIIYVFLSIFIRFVIGNLSREGDDVIDEEETPQWILTLDAIMMLGLILDWLFRLIIFGWRFMTRGILARLEILSLLCLTIYSISEFLDFYDEMNTDLSQFIRTMSILRVVRIIPSFSTIPFFLETLIKSFSILLPFTILLILCTFLYAVVGVMFLSKIPNDYLGSDLEELHLRYKSVDSSMLLLFGIATGENWSILVEGMIDGQNAWERFFIIFYYLSYSIIAKFLLMNVYMIVILHKYHIHCPHKAGIAMEQVKQFTRSWKRMKRYGRKYMGAKYLPELVKELNEPLGVRENTPSVEVDQFVRKIMIAINRDYDNLPLHFDEITDVVSFSDILIGVHKNALFEIKLPDMDKLRQRRERAQQLLDVIKLGISRYIRIHQREKANKKKLQSDYAMQLEELNVLQKKQPSTYRKRVLETLAFETDKIISRIPIEGYSISISSVVEALLKACEQELLAITLQNKVLIELQKTHISDLHIEEKKREYNIFLKSLEILIKVLHEEKNDHVHRIWDSASLQTIGLFETHHPISSIAITINDSIIFIASTDQKLRIYKKKVKKGGKIIFNNLGERSLPTLFLSMSLTNNMRKLYCAGQDNKIYCYHIDIYSKHKSQIIRLSHIMIGHEEPVYDMIFINNWLLSCGGDGQLLQWRLKNTEPTQKAIIKNGFFSTSTPACYSLTSTLYENSYLNDNNQLIDQSCNFIFLGCSDGTVAGFTMHDDIKFLNTEVWEPDFIEECHDNTSVTSIQAAWGYLYTADSLGTIKAWKYNINQDTMRLKKLTLLTSIAVHSAPVSGLLLTSGVLFSASHDFSIVGWKEPILKKKRFIQKYENGFVGHTSPITRLSASNSYIVSCDASGRVLIRSPSNWYEHINFTLAKDIPNDDESIDLRNKRRTRIHSVLSSHPQIKLLELEDMKRIMEIDSATIIRIDQELPPKITGREFLSLIIHHHYPPRSIENLRKFTTSLKNRKSLTARLRRKVEKTLERISKERDNKNPNFLKRRKSKKLIKNFESQKDLKKGKHEGIIVRIRDRKIFFPYKKNKKIGWLIEKASSIYLSNCTPEEIAKGLPIIGLKTSKAHRDLDPNELISRQLIKGSNTFLQLDDPEEIGFESYWEDLPPEDKMEIPILYYNPDNDIEEIKNDDNDLEEKKNEYVNLSQNKLNNNNNNNKNNNNQKEMKLLQVEEIEITEIKPIKEEDGIDINQDGYHGDQDLKIS